MQLIIAEHAIGIWQYGTKYCLGQIPISEMRAGDVVLYFEGNKNVVRQVPDLFPGKSPSHAIIYVGSSNFVAAHTHYEERPQDDITVYKKNGFTSNYLVYRYFE